MIIMSKAQGLSFRNRSICELFSLAIGVACVLFSTSPVRAQMLTTIFAGGNRNSVGGAVYFDLNVLATSGITITGLSTNVSTSGSTVGSTDMLNVYTRPGTASGFQQTSAGWTLVSSGTGTQAALGTPTVFTITSFMLTSGVFGIAIQNVNYSAEYTNGNGSNQVYSNADLSLTAGSANNAAFVSNVNQPRVWNGTINYTSSSAVPEPGVNALLAGLAVTGTGFAFRRLRRRK